MVFAGMFPVDADQYNALKIALEKLKLNDAALAYEVQNSAAMGYGFRIGLLGMLHMEIVQERLEREFGLDIICTAPSVVYGVTTTTGDSFFVDNPGTFCFLLSIAYRNSFTLGMHARCLAPRCQTDTVGIKFVNIVLLSS